MEEHEEGITECLKQGRDQGVRVMASRAQERAELAHYSRSKVGTHIAKN